MSSTLGWSPQKHERVMSKKNMRDTSDLFTSYDRYRNKLLISSPTFVSAKNMKKAKQMFIICVSSFVSFIAIRFSSLSLCKGSSYFHDKSLCHTPCFKRHALYTGELGIRFCTALNWY